jgi:branched-chain amino acid:cation transporter, LIVCS family
MSRSVLDILKASLILFGMMFGAGNVIFPVLLGEYAGAHSGWAIFGFCLAGVVIPFLGLLAMMMYSGDYRKFFGRIGERPGLILFGLIIFLLGPVGAIPRLITISFATMKPYMVGLGPTLFSLLACVGCFALVCKKRGVLTILGYVLTPLLMGALAIIICRGLWMGPTEVATAHTAGESWTHGLHMGYSLLDLFAAFLYANVILTSLTRKEESRGQLARKVLWATGIAAVLLALTYAGLTYVGAFHAANVNAVGDPEEVLRNVSLHMLGNFGGVVACVAVSMACLTTALSLTIVCSNFVHKEMFKDRGSRLVPVAITLALSFAISTLGFGGIARLIGPTLNVLHPFLILLCVFNIAAKALHSKIFA